LNTSPNLKRTVSAPVNAANHGVLDGDDSFDFAHPGIIDEVKCSALTNAPPAFCFAKPGTAQFAAWVISANVNCATNCLVQQSLLQAPDLDNSAKLPPHAIQLFLNISKSLVTTGQAHHAVLSTILKLLLDLIPSDHREWPTMPSTISGFQSHVLLNPTNKHSLVSILPTPATTMLPNGSHAYCCLQEIAAFVLLLPQTAGIAPVPLPLVQLCQSKVMKDFLDTSPPLLCTKCLVSLGVIFWFDGWDPSAWSKNNRSQVHTSTVTLLCIDKNYSFAL
jgi:hypothetical protein